jgi:hypothetical protein
VKQLRRTLATDGREARSAKRTESRLGLTVTFGVASSLLAAVAQAQESGGSDAASLAADAERARAAGQYEACIAKDEASLALEEKMSTRVHLAGCADRAGKVLLALRKLQPVLERAIEQKEADVAELTRLRIEQLMRRLGQLTISMPPKATDTKVTVDGGSVDVSKPVVVDPGQHRVYAEGMLDGTRSSFEEAVTLADGGRATIVVTLRSNPPAARYLTPQQIACMQMARTQDEVFQCVPERERPLVVRAAIEGGGYIDSLDVRVLTPAVRASVASPTQGWHAAATYSVDIVSQASPDLVSTASPRGSDTRHAVTLNGGYKPGAFGVEGGGNFSSESDYVARGGNIALRGDILEKRVSPRVGYALQYDTIGRGGTPYSVFSRELTAHEVSAGAGFVLSKTTVIIGGATAAFERGDQSKPYRLIPMFADGVEVPRGASADEVNAKRLPVRPYEQLPLDRNRYSIGARLTHRLPIASLRIDERLYDDSWDIKATSTDARLLFDIGSHLTAGPHARFHAQTGAKFHQRVYHAEVTPAVLVPIYRTTDRELSPLVSMTGGAAAWWRLTESWTLYASADALYSIYFDSLYTTDRIAGYGTIGIEAEFE